MANQYKNKVVFNGTTLIDISDTTAVQSDVASGKYFYTASGEKVSGTAEIGGDSGYTRTVIVPEQTVTPIYHSDGSVDGYFAKLNNVTAMFEQWAEYIVTFNGTEYYYTALLLWGNNIFMGEQAYMWSGSSGTNQPYPFCIISVSINDSYIYTASADPVTVKVEKIELTGSGGGGGSSTLITKNITANGTYSAEDDNADGYSEVTVNVSSGGSESIYETVFDDSITAVEYAISIASLADLYFAEGETWRVTWDGVEYICQTTIRDGRMWTIGNQSLAATDDGVNEPFLLYNYGSGAMNGHARVAGTHTFKLEKQISSGSSITPNLQSKSATPTTSSQTISPDNGYDGLSSVTVDAIPSQYIVPTGNKSITENDNNIDVTEYATVSVNVSSPSKNIQTVQSTTRRNNTALGSITSLTCGVSGTYDVYWTCVRSSTSGTWGSQLYINGTAYGTENTIFSNNVQNNHLTGVTIPANATVAVYGRSRSGYYIYAPQLTIEQTA